jgi:hypothetical protein
MDFERMVRANTIDMLRTLMQIEDSSIVAVAKIKEIGKETHNWRDDVFFISQSTSTDAYGAFINRNIMEFARRSAVDDMPAPWVIFAERLGACSDVGTWCIYGQKFAEIALLGFRKNPGAFAEKRLHSNFERLADALKRDTFFGDPGNEYSKQQRALLRSAYL